MVTKKRFRFTEVHRWSTAKVTWKWPYVVIGSDNIILATFDRITQ